VDRELTYKVPFSRLRKLGRNSGRKAHPLLWGSRWLLLGSFLALIFALGQFDEPLQRWQASLGLPPLTALVALLVIYIAAIVVLRRLALRQTQTRANFDADIRMRRDDGGIRIGTDEIEYYLKWPGISQMLMEHDGVVVSHGNLFFLIPDSAFAGSDERNAFIRDVFGRLNAEARSRSERSMRPVLDAMAAPPGPGP
jgi:hypothetical protein